MSKFHKHPTNCGPVMACGAACVSWDHKPGEPTSVDLLVAAICRVIDRLKNGKHKHESDEACPVAKSTHTPQSEAPERTRVSVSEAAA